MALKKLFVLLLIILGFDNVNAQKTGFVIFNAMEYHNMPDMGSFGLSRIKLIYELKLLNVDPKFKNDRSRRQINSSMISKEAMEAKASLGSNVPICLDIESWNTRENKGGAESISKYISVFNRFKSFYPNCKLGYFGVFPFSAYLTEAHSGVGNYSYLKGAWNSNNNFLKPIAERIDIAFPPFYTSLKNKTVWEKVVIDQINTIKKFRPNIPIYGFIWPQYFSPRNSKLNYTFIDSEFWKFQLNTLYKLCDGIVIWSSPYDQNHKDIYWNGNWGWWKVTKQFIKDHNIKTIN